MALKAMTEVRSCLWRVLVLCCSPTYLALAPGVMHDGGLIFLRQATIGEQRQADPGFVPEES